MPALWIVLTVLGLVIVCAILSYNRLVSLREQVQSCPVAPPFLPAQPYPNSPLQW